MNTNTTLHTGKVLFYNTERAYGFIIDDASDKAVFIHKTGLIDPIKMNDTVTFEIEKNERGYIAKQVKVINKYIIIIDNN